ncbi:MAG TPA: glycosyltransferase [Candidatus Limnocylindrales bacterium]
MGLRAPWLVLREGERRRWGGDLRRRFLFDGIVERFHARVEDEWRPKALRQALGELRAQQLHPLAHPRRLWVRRPRVASTELLDEVQLATLAQLAQSWVVDVHDDPVEHGRGLGMALPAEEEARLQRWKTTNLEAFRWHVAQSPSFVTLAGMDPARTLIAPNGCETAHFRVLPAPVEPVVGFVSGAAPGRGIELLVEAAALARSEVPDLRLRLWLVATGASSQAYLDGLVASVADRPWIELGSASYADLPAALGSASVLVVPNQPTPYWETVLPIKLFDSMAAGRPLVVTPRTEMAAVVERHRAGVVTRGDAAADMAEALVRLCHDAALRASLGANARLAAEREYDWRVIGARLAEELDGLSSPWARIARRRPRSA